MAHDQGGPSPAPAADERRRVVQAEEAKRSVARAQREEARRRFFAARDRLNGQARR